MIASHVPADDGPANRMPAPQARSIPWFALALLALGCAGFAAAWTAVAMLCGVGAQFRPHCAWPNVARDRGAGDANDPASWQCVARAS